MPQDLVRYNSTEAHLAGIRLQQELALESARNARALTVTSLNSLPLTTTSSSSAHNSRSLSSTSSSSRAMSPPTTLIRAPRATEIRITNRHTSTAHYPSTTQVTVRTSHSSSRTASASTIVKYRREERRVERVVVPVREVQYYYCHTRRAWVYR